MSVELFHVSHGSRHRLILTYTLTGSCYGPWNSLVIYLGETTWVQPASTRWLALDFISWCRFSTYYTHLSWRNFTCQHLWTAEHFLVDPWSMDQADLHKCIHIYNQYNFWLVILPLILMRRNFRSTFVLFNVKHKNLMLTNGLIFRTCVGTTIHVVINAI